MPVRAEDPELSAEPSEPAPPAAVVARRPWRSWLTTALAGLLVLFALVAPNRVEQLSPAVLLRLPVEALVLAAVLLVLPSRARPLLVVPAGVILGLLAVLKIADMGFYEVLVRPADPVLDWAYLSDGVEFLTSSMGRGGAIAVVIAVAALAVALPVLMVLSLLRLTRFVVRRDRLATRVVAVLVVVWIAFNVLGTEFVSGEPVASSSRAPLA
jgi:hypothetical protein